MAHQSGHQFVVRTGPIVNNAADTTVVNMFAGQHPDAPRPAFRAQVGLRDSQLTPVPAPFIVAMSAGYQPTSPRLYVSPNGKAGLRISETTPVPAPFVPSMSAGYGPQ